MDLFGVGNTGGPANAGSSWGGTFARSFFHDLVHGVRQPGQSLGECMNQNVTDMTFGTVDPEKAFNQSLQQVEAAATVASTVTVPTPFGPAAVGPYAVRWAVSSMGGGAIARGLATTAARAGLQGLAVAGAASVGTAIGSAINCR